jgi:phosphoribosyl 1,2-cyclic phosphodiesterase
MLENGPYPVSLKRRVASRLGHLANDQAQGLLSRLDTSQLECLIGMHVSENNNTPELARAALNSGLPDRQEIIQVARQNDGFHWQVL